MALLYALAGVNHFIHPGGYVAIMPSWVPAKQLLVLLSGVIELLLAFFLLLPVTRAFAAWGIIVLLIAVFPANIQMMQNYARDNNPLLWVTILRLPVQGLLVWWAYRYTKPRRS